MFFFSFFFFCHPVEVHKEESCKSNTGLAITFTYILQPDYRVFIEGGHSNINSLSMLVNKNGIKGSDLQHTVVMPFYQVRGIFWLLHDSKGLFLNLRLNSSTERVSFGPFIICISILFWYWPIKMSINMINLIHLIALQLAVILIWDLKWIQLRQCSL